MLEKESAGIAAWTSDNGRTWRAVGVRRPEGYRSCVARVAGTHGPTLIAVGPSGSDYSTDGGRTWTPLGSEGFHSVSVARGGEVVWAVGENGRVARLDEPTRLGRSHAQRR